MHAESWVCPCVKHSRGERRPIQPEMQPEMQSEMQSEMQPEMQPSLPSVSGLCNSYTAACSVHVFWPNIVNGVKTSTVSTCFFGRSYNKNNNQTV